MSVTQVVQTPDRPVKDTTGTPTYPPTQLTPGLQLRPHDILKKFETAKGSEVEISAIDLGIDTFSASNH